MVINSELTSNLKKMPKKLVKELTNDVLALFPHEDKNGERNQELITSWLKVYSALKASHSSGLSNFRIPLDKDFFISFNADISSWLEDGASIHIVRQLPDGEDEIIATGKLHRDSILALQTYTSTLIAHLPNE